ncbi:MAG: DNA polymerase Y family protein, partial [Proteobacteria bacterium]|nr:DNA polymerase Y family protein [Pseudomonadota bacterium]
MKKRIVSIWFPRLATDRIQRQRGAGWAVRPLAAVVEAGSRIMLAGVNRVAEQAGLAPGMTLADARAVAAHLATAPADTGAQAMLLARLARWCGRYTPIAAPGGVDGLFLDITGCAHLFGGEAEMLADMT